MLALSSSLFASSIYKKEVPESLKSYLPKLKKSIKDNHMNILYEMDLMEKFKKSGYAKKFGADFNKNGITSVTTLLLCNGYVGNQVSNIDPDMMVLCPIKVTLIERGNTVTVSFVKNFEVATNREVKALLLTLDHILMHTIDLTIDQYMKDAITNAPEDAQFDD
jgi:uncharacterized protein (DUF302 family)